MPAKEHVKRIGLHEYKYLQMTMTPAVELLSKLSAFAGDAFAPFAKGKLELDSEISPSLIAECVTALMSKLGNSAEVLDIVGRLNSRGLVAVSGPSGKALLDLSNANVAEMHFGEHFGELPAWLAFALGAQFGNFFGLQNGGGALGAIFKAQMEKLKAKAGTGSPSPTTSAASGQSTG
jgi:hypothetical protein